MALLLGAGSGLLIVLLMRFLLKRRTLDLKNTKESINSLFTAPLIFAAALLSFAHGSNDVANAIGPLAAIADTVMSGAVTRTATVPLWIMVIGAVGIAIGLALYGPKLIRTVGTEITDLDQMRAFCIAMAATLTVIAASQLGLPVSSTHIAIGGVFGVGFLREYLKNRYEKMIEEIKLHHIGTEQAIVETFLNEFSIADPKAKQVMFEQLKEKAVDLQLTKKEYKKVRNAFKSELVQRSALKKIVLAWIVTVPASGLLAALIYTVIVGIVPK
jgi:PiT family inorganic phosphate transporter